MWGLRFLGSQWLRARLCCRKLCDSIFLVILLYPTLTLPVQCLAQRRSIRNIKREDRNR